MLMEYSVQFSRSVMSYSLQPYGLQDARLPCPSPVSGACSNSCLSSWWCHPTILCCHLLLLPSIFPSIKVFSNESVLCISWPKYWSFNFNISPSNEYSGLISLRLTGFIPVQSKGLSSVFSNTTVQKHQFFSAQFSLWFNSHIHTWPRGKTIALTRQTFVDKVMSLLFNMLYRLVIAFLPRSKHLLNFIYSDFRPAPPPK